MEPLVSIIVESPQDMNSMSAAALFLDEMEIPFEVCALNVMYDPEEVAIFAHNASARGLQVVIVASHYGMTLPRTIAAATPLPVVAVPMVDDEPSEAVRVSQKMPEGVPLACVGTNEAKNAAVLAMQMLSLVDPEIAERLNYYKASLKQQMQRYAVDLTDIVYRNKTN